MQTITYTLQPGRGFTIDPVNSAIVQFADRRSDILTGTNRGDRLVGTRRDDRLEGLGGNDTLNGSAGNDVLIGGAGSDIMTGGSGRDVFGIQTGVGVDTITDFRNQDRIGIGANVNFGQIDIVRQGRDTLIRSGRDELAVLRNVRANQITAADFVRV
ncbi:MAG: hypothetical protein HC895_00090 [Leptolyngbyaceae cyanobacterium SM1_3_5]|nr:hypothetical protein [Leptolyngbyaceae cyanobacterium SM1_3_5]